jgi:CheY-like chemotaxis protein/glycine cleavage system H lipoate-binding protein
MSDRAKILIVDDEQPVCTSIAEALGDGNYLIDTALSGEEALTKGKTVQYDVVVTDLMMPGISGMELLRSLKQQYPRIMFIMVTGYPSVKSAVQAMKLGAFDYMPKPFTPNDIRSLVVRALAKKRLGDKGHIKEPEVVPKKPEQLYCIPDNSWVRIEKDETVQMGIHHKILQTIDEISSLELPKVHDTRFQGETCIVIADSKNHLHRIWTPVSGKVIEVNEEVKHNPAILKDDPYGKGWLLRMAPMHLKNELENLASWKS